MNKIEKAHKLIINRLPKSYPQVGIKLFPNTKAMLKQVAKDGGETLKEVCDYYTNTFKKLETEDTKKNYMKTKYYMFEELNPRESWKDITMLANDPLYISLENTNKKKFHHIVFLLLHEIGHHYNKRSGNYNNEHMADEFAIRWIKKFIKEGLIENYIK